MAFVVAPLLLPQVPVSSFSFSSKETILHISRSSSSSKDSDDDDTKKFKNPYADLDFGEVSRKFESPDFLEDAVNTFGASFSSCTVNVDSLSQLLPEDTSTSDGTSTVTGNGEDKFLSLSFLNELREEDESFLPQTIYLRDCMKFIFDLSEKDDRKPMRGKHILIGSPGVGKSVLFFLMALSKARSTPIVYFRKTKDDDFCSVFFMNASENGQVRIVFSRSLLSLITSSKTIFQFLQIQKVDKTLYYTFLDGPKHDDKEETMNGYFYDYFCTSGGYPVPKDEAMDRTFVWILDAWTKEEVIDALTQKSAQELLPSASQQGSSELCAPAVEPIDKNRATELYSLCGGGIRRIIRATKGREDIESWLQETVGRLNKETMELALTSTMRGDSNPDSIRSMFWIRSGSTKLMRAIQIVDSRFALDLLVALLDVKRFLEAYRFAKSLGLNSVQGDYFEQCCHCWFRTKISAQKTSTGEQGFPLQEYVKGKGTGAESVRNLTEAECYWVPSVSNFADIDAAFVHQGTLYALQYTIAKTHTFNCTRFGEKVLAVVNQTLSFTKVCVAFVVPESTKTFKRPVEPGEISFTTKGSSERPDENFCCCSLAVETWRVKTTYEQQLSESLRTYLNKSLGKEQS